MEPGSPVPARGLWNKPDFLKLWAGQTVSMLGSQVSFLAIPTTAALTLKAAPFQMGLITTIEAVPVLLFGFFAGVWADRLPRRPIMIVADLGRFLTLSFIPFSYLLGILSLELFYLLAFFVSTFSIFFNVAAGAYLPSLLDKEQLVEGNSRIALSQSVSEIAGPGLSGLLIQILTAPLAILADAFSFLVSALSLAWIRRREEPARLEHFKRNVLREIAEGLRFVLFQPVLRSLVGSSGTLIFFNTVLEAVFILYLTREVGMSPALFGLAFALGSVGSVVGATLAGRITHYLGIGKALLVAVMVTAGADLLIPLSGLAPLALAVFVLALAQFFFGMARPLYTINQSSLRQIITPPTLLGRSNASISVIVSGLVPIIGGLVGGFLGQGLGLQLTLIIAAVGEGLASLWLFFSPVMAMKNLPA